MQGIERTAARLVCQKEHDDEAKVEAQPYELRGRSQVEAQRPELRIIQLVPMTNLIQLMMA
jgi:hypothetical protein